MRSIAGESVPADDRTAKARIRDAAIACIAEHGIGDTTARRVADAAGVSPGLVIHYFGSMEGLRSACDEYVAASIRRIKREALAAGPSIDVLSTLRSFREWPMMGYLARVLADDSPAVAALVDELVEDAEGYIQLGVESGMMKPTEDPRGRAVIISMWQLGMLVLHHHLERLLGVDLTDLDLGSSPHLAGFVGSVYEIYGHGVLTDAFATHVREAFAVNGETTSNEGQQ
jgi:AcrR family transcriptional regulator